MTTLKKTHDKKAIRQQEILDRLENIAIELDAIINLEYDISRIGIEGIIDISKLEYFFPEILKLKREWDTL